MKRALHIFLLIVFLFLHYVANATHIVGGTLTYVHNGGSSYTVTLKLFRDCSKATNLSFPGTVNITVLGYDGALFSPTKDFSMTMNPPTPVPSGLPACSTPPTPMPCVEQAIYTKTINNLPPNAGGYHLYFQYSARNFSLTNVNATGNNIAESFYAHIPGNRVIWGEDFVLANGVTVDNGSTAWSIAAGATPPSSAKITNNAFEIKGANNAQQTWTTDVVNISASSGGVNLSVSLSELGTLDSKDSIMIYYRLNGGSLTLFSTNGVIVDDFGAAIASNSTLVGNTLQVIVKIHFDANSPNSEIYNINNVMMYENVHTDNSNPTFTFFPPLFICLGQNLNFDHSAIDIDGDSLVYDLYNPYNGYTGSSATGSYVAPTFSGNVATFTPVNFLPGYSTNNPLGGLGLNISSTGLLTGIPPTLGQYVVGIRVKEYRNGVYLDETLRDFQFNIVTCSDPLAVTITSPDPVICFGTTSTTITANPTGGKPPYKYLWNNSIATKTVSVGQGVYTVKVTDAVNCAPVFATVTVISYTVPVSANAGTDQIICSQHPTTTLNGAVFGPSTGIWTGGAGTYSPYNTTLNAQYTPTVAEIAAGFVDLTLTTTGSGSCPTGTDVERINFKGFLGTSSIVPINVSCYGANNGSATYSNTGGSAPYSYFWSNSNTTATINNLTPATYSVTITDNIGCSSQTSVNITEPTQLKANQSIKNVSCFGGSDGSIAMTASNGTPPYTYLWLPGNQTTVSITGGAGTYSVTITDANGCSIQKINTISESAQLNLALSSTNLSCFNASNGTVTSLVSGGTPIYSYNWSSGETSPNLSGIQAGTFSLTVTDSKGCKSTKSILITQPTVLNASTSSTNISCNGLADGSVTAITSGGLAGYTYLWKPGLATSATVTNLIAGTYTLYVTDANSCLATAFSTIVEPAVLSVGFVSQTNINCFSGNNGSVTANTSGGTPKYSYVWLPGGQTSNIISNITAGTYSVTTTDTRGCKAKGAIIITEPALFSLTTSKTDETCNYLDNGIATAIPFGGVAGYTFLWQPGALTTNSINNLSNGTYSVYATDAKGCIANSTAVILEPGLLGVIFSSKTNVSCYGGNNGALTASSVGGTAGYSYLWQPGGATTATINNLTAGTYTVTVTDINGCIAINSITITEPVLLTTKVSSVNETCDYSNNGSVNIVPSGGTAPYNYLWQPGMQNTSSITNLSAGTYSVTITDSKGCTSNSIAIINEPPKLTINFSGQINVSCFGGNNGAVSSSIFGGTPNYSYLWSTGSATTNSISGLTSGTYSLTIIDSKNCTAQNSITITQPIAPISVSVLTTNVSCFGEYTGAANASVSGGTFPYTYFWLSGGGTTQIISPLAAGTYSVAIRDANGCKALASNNITQPSQIILTTTSVNSDCGQSNGLASVVLASGGNAPYSYKWFPSGNTNTTATGLLAGTYSLAVTDNGGCIASTQVDVSENTAPVITITSVNNVSCHGGNDGAVTIGLSGGLAPYTYSWVPYGGNSSTATGLVAGAYTASVIDANGCKASITTNSNVLEPPLISVSVSTSNVSCFAGNDGSASVFAIGGTPGYIYKWLPSGTIGSNITNLSSALYSVEVKDAKNCIKVQSFSIMQPTSPLSVNVSFDSVSCFGGSDGSVSALASGGTANYSYSWMPGNYSGPIVSNLSYGTYTVTVVDAEQCSVTNTITVNQPNLITLSTGSSNSYCSLPNGTATVVALGGTGAYKYLWSPFGGTNLTATGLLSGSYTITVTDKNFCTLTNSVTINDQPGPTALISSKTDVSCFGGNDGNATATSSSGTGSFIYLWSPSGGSNLSANGLTAGTYTFSVTDANGCKSFTQGLVINQSTIIAPVISKTMVSCFGLSNGAATVNSSGGTPNYTYLWLPSGTTGTSITNLSAATYTLQVSDANNCSRLFPFTITQPNLLTANITPVKNVSCYQGSNGEASVVVSGGVPVYSYQWLPIGGNSDMAAGLLANTYTVLVTDINNCSTSATVNITQPLTPLSATGVDGITSCFGSADGIATINPVGGTANYSYAWSPIASTAKSVTGLSAQQYFILVTDNNGCKTNTSVMVSEPTPIIGNLLFVSQSCELPNGSITSQISGGNPPYTYLWSPGSTTNSKLTSVGSGTYTLQITDSHNCTLLLTQQLVDIPKSTVIVSSIDSVSCYGGNDGSATISITKGLPPYTINWLPFGGNNLTATFLNSGTYTVNVSDSLGCISIVNATVLEPLALGISVVSQKNILCNGDSSGSITVSPTGGTFPYSYLWLPTGESISAITNLIAGTYTVNVTDYNSCVQKISIDITQPAVLLSSISSKTNPLCYGLKGKASVIATGGTIPYKYSWSNDSLLSGSVENLYTGSYTITVTDTHACQTKSSVKLTEPSQVITIAGLDDSVCVGQTAKLTAVAKGGVGNYYYAWQPTGVINAGILNIVPTGDTTYIVVGYDKTGCPGTADTVSAHAYFLSSGSIDAMAISPICKGRSSVISAKALAGAGPLTYQWDNGLGSGSGEFIVTPLQPTTYVVTAYSAVCNTYAVDSVDITFNPQPILSIGSDTNVLCVPGSLQFFDKSVIGNVFDPIISWNWNFGDGTFSSEQNPKHTFNREGTYFINLTIGTVGGCSSNNATASYTIEAHSYPTADFKVNTPVLNIPVEKLKPSNNTVGASIYNWNFGDGGTSTDYNPVHDYRSVGIFNIQLIATSKYSCSDTAYGQITTNTDFSFPNVFSPNTKGPNGGIYDPNDFSNDVFFPFTSGVLKYKLEIFNRWGELIFESNDINIGWDGYYRGQLCQQDVYIWKAYLKLNNGKEFNKTGDITLLR